MVIITRNMNEPEGTIITFIENESYTEITTLIMSEP